MHLLRAVGPYISQDKLLCFNDTVGASLGRIIGEPVKGLARLQATLPTSQSGLGLMSAATMGQVVFIVRELRRELLLVIRAMLSIPFSILETVYVLVLTTK